MQPVPAVALATTTDTTIPAGMELAFQEAIGSVLAMTMMPMLQQALASANE